MDTSRLPSIDMPKDRWDSRSFSQSARSISQEPAKTGQNSSNTNPFELLLFFACAGAEAAFWNLFKQKQVYKMLLELIRRERVRMLFLEYWKQSEVEASGEVGDQNLLYTRKIRKYCKGILEYR